MIVLNLMNIIGLCLLLIIWKTFFQSEVKKYDWLDKVVVFVGVVTITIILFDVIRAIF